MILRYRGGTKREEGAGAARRERKRAEAVGGGTDRDDALSSLLEGLEHKPTIRDKCGDATHHKPIGHVGDPRVARRKMYCGK